MAVSPLPAAEHDFVGLGPRFFAKLIDTGILLLVGVGLSIALLRPSGGADQTLVMIASWLYALLALAYTVLLEASGGALGRRILGTRIVAAADGGKPGLKRALVRNLMHIVDALPILYLVGILTIVGSGKKQRLGDRVAGTYVVRK